jgi:hypothetical protein
MSNDRIRLELTKEEVIRLHTLVCHVDDPVVQSVYRRLDPAVDAMMLELTPEQLWALAEAMPESATDYVLVERIYALSNASWHPQSKGLPDLTDMCFGLVLLGCATLLGYIVLR